MRVAGMSSCRRPARHIERVSHDARRVATRIQATVPVADIHINLREVRGPGHDSWVRGKQTSAAADVSTARAAEENEHVN